MIYDEALTFFGEILDRLYMSEDIKSTISLYTRLFGLPRDRTLLLIIFGGALIIGGLNEILRGMGVGGVLIFGFGAIRGLFITGPAVALGILTLWLATRHRSILNRHRLIGIMAVAVVVQLFAWFLSTLTGAAIEFIMQWSSGGVLGRGIADLFYRRNLIMGASLTTAIIFLTVLSLSTIGPIKGSILSLVFPVTTIIMYLVSEPYYIITHSWWIFLGVYLVCGIIFIIGSLTLLYLVGRPLRKAFKVDGIQLFRGFLAVWMEGKADQMEACLSQIGQESTVPLSIIRFSTDRQELRLVYVISGVHPGPFKNTGSSALPNVIAEWGRENLNTIAASPHGTATHDLNLVSQEEVTRFMTRVQEVYPQIMRKEKVSQFTRSTSGTIQVGCQIFGDTALLVITRSPHDMDDISLAVGNQIANEVKKHVKHCIIVDTHNCMTELKESVYEDSELVPDMIKAATEATRNALSTPREKARLGVATKIISEYSEEEGMGSEGITTTVIEIAGQKMAYVLLDGNNMVTGLREKIVQTLVSEIVDDAEVMTTDTHQTSAISSHNGYSPIGERIPHSFLIDEVLELVKEAISKLEPINVEIFSGETQPLYVMGEGTVEKLTSLIPVSARVAKIAGVASYTIAFILSLILLLLI